MNALGFKGVLKGSEAGLGLGRGCPPWLKGWKTKNVFWGLTGAGAGACAGVATTGALEAGCVGVGRLTVVGRFIVVGTGDAGLAGAGLPAGMFKGSKSSLNVPAGSTPPLAGAGAGLAARVGAGLAARVGVGLAAIVGVAANVVGAAVTLVVSVKALSVMGAGVVVWAPVKGAAAFCRLMASLPGIFCCS